MTRDPGVNPSTASPIATAVAVGRSHWLRVLLVAALAFGVFAFELSSEPPFVDESAYLSQTYFLDLALRGRINDAGWLEYPAYDLPPLPKYLIGGALKLAGYRTHVPAEARRWYANTSSRFDPPGALDAARWPSVLLGAIGCAALYGLGTQVFDGRVGLGAALLLMVNPLYRLHARRAMSDIPAEAFLLLSLAGALWCWRRSLQGRFGWPFGLMVIATGVAAGLAPLAKLNGALACLVIADWAVFAIALRGFSLRRRVAFAAAAVAVGCVALVTFAALNPFLTAHPKGRIQPAGAGLERMSLWERGGHLIRHRMTVSRGQMDLFPNDAVRGPREKLAVLAVQGFGRFGPFGPGHSDSTRRYDPQQDWGGVLWLPAVCVGIIGLCRRGWAQIARGEPPTAWAFLVEAAMTISVVAAYLPLAWDRYFLSLQPVAALAAAAGAVSLVDGATRRWASPSESGRAE